MSSAADNLRKIFEKAQKINEDSAFETMADVLKNMAPSIATCRACQTKNRVKPGKASPRCGKCGLPLQ